MTKILAQDDLGKRFLIDYDSISSSNVILRNVDCASSVYEGAAVRMSSGTAVNALADTFDNSNVIGVCENKLSVNKCDIRVLGVTEGDIFSGLDESKEYYLSDAVAGAITLTPPTASGSILLRLGQPLNATSLLVLKGLRTVRL